MKQQKKLWKIMQTKNDARLSVKASRFVLYFVTGIFTFYAVILFLKCAIILGTMLLLVFYFIIGVFPLQYYFYSDRIEIKFLRGYRSLSTHTFVEYSIRSLSPTLTRVVILKYLNTQNELKKVSIEPKDEQDINKVRKILLEWGISEVV